MTKSKCLSEINAVSDEIKKIKDHIKRNKNISSDELQEIYLDFAALEWKLKEAYRQ